VFHLTDVGTALWNEVENDERVAVARQVTKTQRGKGVAETLGVTENVKAHDDLTLKLE
jgi:hypothetical protein